MDESPMSFRARLASNTNYHDTMSLPSLRFRKEGLSMHTCCEETRRHLANGFAAVWVSKSESDDCHSLLWSACHFLRLLEMPTQSFHAFPRTYCLHRKGNWEASCCASAVFGAQCSKMPSVNLHARMAAVLRLNYSLH